MECPRRAIVVALVLSAVGIASTTSRGDCPEPPAGELLTPGWPLEDTQTNHQIGATFEYMRYDEEKIHGGLDIYAEPFLKASGGKNSSAPYVVSTVAARVSPVHLELLSEDQYEAEPGLEINFVFETPTANYGYGHLTVDSLTAEFANEYNNGCEIPAGRRIGKIWRWSQCSSYSHLHYEIFESTDTITNPLQEFPDLQDAVDPILGDPVFYESDDDTCDKLDSWVPLGTGGPGCTQIHGAVDMVVEATDRQVTAPTSWTGDEIAPRFVRFKACGETDPECPDWKPYRDFSSMPDTWPSGEGGDRNPACSYFSVQLLAETETDYCGHDKFFVVPTHIVGPTDGSGSIDPTAAWDTSEIADGFYTVTVEAEDFAGNSTVKRLPVCVNNNDECGGKLLIQDCVLDDGAEPSSPDCGRWESPDLFTRTGPGLLDVDLMICMTNVGCKNIGLKTEIRADLTVSLPTTFGRPRAPLKFVTRTVKELAPDLVQRTGGPPVIPNSWKPDESRCFKIDLPFPVVRLAGDVTLDVAVSMSGDPAHPTTTALWDNNKAAKIFEGLPALADGSDLKLSQGFHFNKDEMFKKRRLEAVIDLPPGLGPGRVEGRLLLGPGIEVGRVTGGAVVGGLTDEALEEWSAETPLDELSADCPELRDARPLEVPAGSCWKVIGGLADGGRLQLHDVRADESAPYVLQLWSAGEEKKPERAEVVIREFGTPVDEKDGKERELGALTMEIGVGEPPKKR